jgi:hypothetical protein
MSENGHLSKMISVEAVQEMTSKLITHWIKVSFNSKVSRASWSGIHQRQDALQVYLPSLKLLTSWT